LCKINPTTNELLLERRRFDDIERSSSRDWPTSDEAAEPAKPVTDMLRYARPDFDRYIAHPNAELAEMVRA
jgi:hypothetical protein